jgi:polyisoprenoid-binding protein YceI
MKNSTIYLAVAFFAFSISVSAVDEEGVDPRGDSPEGMAFVYNAEASTVYWEGSKPGGKHHGTIEVVNGSAVMDGDQITGGTFQLDMSTIRNEDVQNDGMRERLVNHLKSEDFFYVEKYPTATFTITGVDQMENDPSMHMVTGDLTVRGNTRPITFPATITMDDRMVHARTGEIVLDRTQWDVNHKSKSIFAGLKDNFIDDEMIVRLDVHLNRN